MKIKGVFDQIFSMENLYGALEDASIGRRYNRDVMYFNLNAWECLNEIRESIYNGTYRIDKYYIFYVYEPKKRMIMSIKFKHRIVQWAIYRVINPMLIKGYIRDTYGCITGRGPLMAAQRLQYWLREASKDKSIEWYFLKLDISKYFYRISHKVLKRALEKKIKDKRLMELLEKIIDCEHTPFGLPPGCSPGEVPLEERLYDVGMPIGNLMSQVFANVYLDILDQYCKRTLRIRYYIRYMDDVIILGNKEKLRTWKRLIAEFLEAELALHLNDKTCIRPISQGIEFVGYRIWADKLTLRKKTTLHMKRVLKHRVKQYSVGDITMQQAFDTLACYIGMLEHCDSRILIESMVSSYVLTRNAGKAKEGVSYEKSYDCRSVGHSVKDHRIAAPNHRQTCACYSPA